MRRALTGVAALLLGVAAVATPVLVAQAAPDLVAQAAPDLAAQAAPDLVAVAAPSPPILELPSDPELPVLVFHQHHELIAVPAQQPLLRIWADGRVRVHRPFYMQKAGDFALQMTPGEVLEIFRRAEAAGLFAFDREATRNAVHDSEARRRAQSGEFYERSDVSRTDIQLRFARYAPAGANRIEEQGERSIQWRDLSWQAHRYPEISALSALAELEARLLRLTERSDFEEVQQ